MAHIMIIDDEEKLCNGMKSVMEHMGHSVDYAVTILDGMKKAEEGFYDVVFLDVRLPDGNGLDILKELRMTPSNPEVIIMTGKADPECAEIAIKNEAWDYLQKPLLIDEMKLHLTGALQYREETKDVRVSGKFKRDGIVGESPQMKKCLSLASQAASSDINVLIAGATGTGKEQFAWVIHENSRRSENHFVIVDCAALPETLTESILFGHVKGAFTGADRDREGLIHQANGGTLFLDEVGELPLSVQKAFLRVLQEHTYRPVGSKRESKSDFRLVAATNRDLQCMVEEGLFREDLFFRIKSLSINLPTLTERRQDIPELAMYYIIKICEREGVPLKGFSSQFIGILASHRWPGNVREFINALEWAISKARYEPTLFPKHLPEYIRINIARSAAANTSQEVEQQVSVDNKPDGRPILKYKEFRETILFENEKSYLRELLYRTNGNIEKACSVSGLGRARLYGLMKNHGIVRSYSFITSAC